MKISKIYLFTKSFGYVFISNILQNDKFCPMKKTPLAAIILIFFGIIQPFMVLSQLKAQTWKNKEDSLLVAHRHQSHLHPYAGLDFSSDAEMYYLGPSFEAGSDITFTNHLALGTYFHYFYVGVNNRLMA
jgi:hypothetical protein